MLRHIFATVALVVVLVLPAVTPADLTPATSRKTAPDFTLTDAKGRPVKLSAYKGRVVLLDFWATWCTGCKVEIPWYMEFQSTYKKSGLSALGVSMDDDGWKSVKPFLQQHKIGDRFGFNSMPATLLIDRNGKIADLHVGMVDKDAFESEIQILLKESAFNKAVK